ncbi:hypothetical protein ABEW05_001089 [Botrytis cinerea]
MKSKTTSGYAVISGAGGGIGKNSGLSFAESGASGILFADLSLSPQPKTAALECKSYISNPNCRILSMHVDVTDEKSVQEMVDTAVKEFGRIDYYVHSAGVNFHFHPPPPPKLTPFRSALAHPLPSAPPPSPNSATSSTPTCAARSSVTAPSQAPCSYQGRYTTRSLGRGSIVSLGSANSVVAFPGKTSYTTAKHAVVGITKSGGE